MLQKTLIVPIVLAAILLLPLPARARNGIRVADGELLLTAGESLGIKSTDAKRIQRHARDAFRLVKRSSSNRRPPSGTRASTATRSSPPERAG